MARNVNGRRETVTSGTHGRGGLSLARARELCVRVQCIGLTRLDDGPALLSNAGWM
ncbi:hypothetical protein GCM10023157_10000 [Gluconacetobacter asukensis]